MRKADPSDLMIFARVVEAGSFSLAAERLGLPKSTVSRRISALEAGLGERLFQRTTRRIVLTGMGQRILTSAEQIVNEVEVVTALAEDSQVTPSGRLRVSMPGDLASIAFAPMLAQFAVSYPAVQLDLDLSPDYVDVLADSFDLAIRIGGEALGMRLTMRHLIDIGISLYAAPSYVSAFGEPDTPQSLARHSMLVLHTGGETVSWRLEKEAQVMAADMSGRRVSANSYDLLLRLARAGARIAALPDIFAEAHIASGELKRVLPDWFLDELLSFLKPRPLR